MTEEVSISRDAALMIWGKRTAFFRKYGNYIDKLYEKDPETQRIQRRTVLPPVADVHEAIALLFEGFSDKTQRHIDMQAYLPGGERGPALVIQVFNGGYGGCELSDQHTFPIAKEIVEELRRDRLLRGTPHMGYTDMNELHLNDRAIDRIFKEIEVCKGEPEEAETSD